MHKTKLLLFFIILLFKRKILVENYVYTIFILWKPPLSPPPASSFPTHSVYIKKNISVGNETNKHV